MARAWVRSVPLTAALLAVACTSDLPTHPTGLMCDHERDPPCAHGFECIDDVCVHPSKLGEGGADSGAHVSASTTSSGTANASRTGSSMANTGDHGGGAAGGASDCAVFCTQPAHGQAVCEGKSCRIECHAGFSHCGEGCVDTQSNPAHCGGCGQPCLRVSRARAASASRAAPAEPKTASRPASTSRATPTIAVAAASAAPFPSTGGLSAMASAASSVTRDAPRAMVDASTRARTWSIAAAVMTPVQTRWVVLRNAETVPARSFAMRT